MATDSDRTCMGSEVRCDRTSMKIRVVFGCDAVHCGGWVSEGLAASMLTEHHNFEETGVCVRLMSLIRSR